MSGIFDVMYSYISPIYTPRHDALDREDLTEPSADAQALPRPPADDQAESVVDILSLPLPLLPAANQDGAAPVGDLPVEPSHEVAQGRSSQTSSTVLSKIGKWTHDNRGKLYGALFVILALGALGIGGALTYNYTSSWWANTALPWMQNHAGILMLGWGGTTLSVALLAAIYFGAKKINERVQEAKSDHNSSASSDEDVLYI